MGTPADKARGGQVQGEGDYEAGRRYDRAQSDFVRKGRADEGARDAEPKDAAEAAELERAEQAGKAHSKGEAPGDTTPPPRGDSR